MTFMNAKEARPVDDPKALVPFGWAPGGYHCAACSTCGEAHAGSDKRSMRCQDCAEALRDKRADVPTPTTRETADHAELAWKFEALAVEASAARNLDGAESMMVSIQTIYDLITSRNALLSEIAALRGERDGLMATRRWNVIEAGPDLHVCDGDHEKSDRCDYQVFVPLDRATQAERQRDEAVGLLRELADGRSQKNNINEYDDLSGRASTLLANQGADQ